MGVVLYPNIDFLPKVASQFHVTQPIEVLAMNGEEPGLCLLYVRWALKFYLVQTASFRDDDDIKLFLAMVGRLKENPCPSSKFSNGWWRQ